MSTNRHHLRAYIVFLIISLLLVGILAYLYTPFTIDASKLVSQATVSAEVPVMSAEIVIRGETETDSSVNKRIRLTNLLLRYQKELADLESWDVSLPSKQQQLKSLRQKIENLELMITELSQ